MTAFCVMRWHEGGAQQQGGIALDAMAELEWLRTELHLTDGQFAKVRDLHADYRPKCVEMCNRISEAQAKTRVLAVANRVITPEYQAALQNYANVRVECQKAMLNHLYETAATLKEDQATRFLEAMLPIALDFSHIDSGDLHAR
jgi:hypothetical protein